VFTARYGLYLCVLCGSQNKQRLFTYTALTECVYCAVRTGSLNIIQVDLGL
jgi:DNA-directed RNA polymerase subunit RPC12/RpoP